MIISNFFTNIRFYPIVSKDIIDYKGKILSISNGRYFKLAMKDNEMVSIKRITNRLKFDFYLLRLQRKPILGYRPGFFSDSNNGNNVQWEFEKYMRKTQEK